MTQDAFYALVGFVTATAAVYAYLIWLASKNVK